MRDVGIDVLATINEKLKMMNEKYAYKDFSFLITHFYLWLQTPDNQVRQRINIVDNKSPNIISKINLATQ